MEQLEIALKTLENDDSSHTSTMNTFRDVLEKASSFISTEMKQLEDRFESMKSEIETIWSKQLFRGGSSALACHGSTQDCTIGDGVNNPSKVLLNFYKTNIISCAVKCRKSCLQMDLDTSASTSAAVMLKTARNERKFAAFLSRYPSAEHKCKKVEKHEVDPNFESKGLDRAATAAAFLSSKPDPYAELKRLICDKRKSSRYTDLFNKHESKAKAGHRINYRLNTEQSDTKVRNVQRKHGKVSNGSNPYSPDRANFLNMIKKHRKRLLIKTFETEIYAEFFAEDPMIAEDCLALWFYTCQTAFHAADELKQFERLCCDNFNSPLESDCTDLQNQWNRLHKEVNKVNSLFAHIEALEQHSWKRQAVAAEEMDEKNKASADPYQELRQIIHEMCVFYTQCDMSVGCDDSSLKTATSKALEAEIQLAEHAEENNCAKLPGVDKLRLRCLSVRDITQNCGKLEESDQPNLNNATVQCTAEIQAGYPLNTNASTSASVLDERTEQEKSTPAKPDKCEFIQQDFSAASGSMGASYVQCHLPLVKSDNVLDRWLDGPKFYELVSELLKRDPQRKGELQQILSTKLTSTHFDYRSSACVEYESLVSVDDQHQRGNPVGDEPKNLSKSAVGQRFLYEATYQRKRLMLEALELDIYAAFFKADPAVAEDVIESLRCTLASAYQLANGKLSEFEQLCRKHLNPPPGDDLTVLLSDLHALWDLLNIEIEQLNSMLEEIVALKRNNWTVPPPPTMPYNVPEAKKMPKCVAIRESNKASDESAVKAASTQH